MVGVASASIRFTSGSAFTPLVGNVIRFVLHRNVHCLGRAHVGILDVHRSFESASLGCRFSFSLLLVNIHITPDPLERVGVCIFIVGEAAIVLLDYGPRPLFLLAEEVLVREHLLLDLLLLHQHVWLLPCA